MKSVFLFVLVLVMACHQGKSDKNIGHKNNEPQRNAVSSKKISNSKQQSDNNLIDGTVGVISVTENLTEKDTIRLFNEDGSLWYKFSFFYDDSDGKFDFPNDKFKPLAFHPDYFLLALTVTDKLNDRYEVTVNETTGLRKYLKDKNFLLFRTWEEHILSVFSVDFNEANNPLLEKPSENADRAYYDKDEFYHPSQIKGEWLQVKWGSEGSWKYGWIKWKDGEKLLIELFYFA